MSKPKYKLELLTPAQRELEEIALVLFFMCKA